MSWASTRGSDQNLVCKAGDLGLILGSGRSPGELRGQRYSPWGHKESDTTVQLTLWRALSQHP